MITKLFINIILVFIVLSCSRHQDDSIENSKVKFIKYLEVNNLLSIAKNKPNSIYLFIPTRGCKDCLEKSIDFMKNHPLQNQYIIMDTVVSEIERFKKDFGLTNQSKMNVFYDSKNTLTSGVYSEFPYLIDIDWDEKVIKRTILNAYSIDEELSKIN